MAAVTFAVTAGSAVGKCCPLSHIIISDFHGEDVRIDASALEDELEDWEMQLLSWPVFNGMAKGDEAPPGHLGRGYLVSYVHEAGDYDGEVVVRERMYPFARPNPVAFTLKGQTQDWIAKDDRVYPVEWGWRPVQDGIVAGLFAGGEDTRVIPGDDPQPVSMRGSLGWVLAAVLAALVIVGSLLVFDRRRDSRDLAAGSARTDPQELHLP